MSTLLIIGGTGFFGKSFLDSFRRGQLDEWGVDRIIAMSRHAVQLKHLAPQLLADRIELVNADIGTIDSLPEADYVIHAAASTDARNYLSNPDDERRNIQAGVYNYSRLAPSVHAKSKIVYVSSGAVYGVQPANVLNIPESYSVGSLLEMLSSKRDYALAKQVSEAAFQQLAATGMQVSIARCFAFVGAWLPRDQHFAIGNFLRDAMAGQDIQVNSTFPVYRSYMHADDLVRWLMTIAEHADATCPCINVGSDRAVTMGELARIVASEFGVGVLLPKEEEGRVDRYVPSIDKAKSSLGLDVSINLEDAIRQTYRSIRAQEARVSI